MNKEYYEIMKRMENQIQSMSELLKVLAVNNLLNIVDDSFVNLQKDIFLSNEVSDELKLQKFNVVKIEEIGIKKLYFLAQKKKQL